MRLRFISLLAGIVLAGVILAVVLRQPQSTDPLSVLAFPIGTDVTSLDPVRLTEDSPRLIASQVLETLVGYDEQLKLQPVLAESWQASSGGTVWRFRLRSGVYFHDDPAFGGKPRTVTAADVIYSLERLLDPKTQTLGAFILTDVVKGATEFMEGKASSVVGITAEDERTVTFHLTKPYALFPARLSLPFAAIIAREAVDHYGKQWGTHPVGTGPFQIKSWDASTSEIVLERSANYWRQISTTLRGIRFRILKSEATQLLEFSQGKLDALEVTSTIAPQVLASDGTLTARFRGLELLKVPVLNVHFVGFNFQKPLLQDKNFRLAANYAVDKNFLTGHLLNGLAKPASGPLVPPLFGADEARLYPQSVDQAKALLRQSSYRGQELVYVTDNSTQSVAVAELLQSQFAAIGIKILIDKNPESVWLDKLGRGQFDLAKLYWAFDYPSPDNGLSQFLTSNFAPAGPNFLHYSDAEFDRVYDLAVREPDQTAAERHFSELNQRIRNEAPWVFLYYPTRTILVQAGVGNLHINALSFSLFLNDVVKTEK